MLVLIISVLITLDLIGAKPAVKYYSSKYEHIDVGAILNNRRMVNYYTACLLSQGPCPPEGVELKINFTKFRIPLFIWDEKFKFIDHLVGSSKRVNLNLVLYKKNYIAFSVKNMEKTILQIKTYIQGEIKKTQRFNHALNTAHSTI
ncbi:hypothetical protein ABEB36_009389 [Hypothenemus hampei]|uniref:Uncharacterized protein n=1 Tax=Hypothenemus hampei TaxID=57062 RepID=A0ABD1EG71_HYPHA